MKSRKVLFPEHQHLLAFRLCGPCWWPQQRTSSLSIGYHHKNAHIQLILSCFKTTATLRKTKWLEICLSWVMIPSNLMLSHESWVEIMRSAKDVPLYFNGQKPAPPGMYEILSDRIKNLYKSHQPFFFFDIISQRQKQQPRDEGSTSTCIGGSWGSWSLAQHHSSDHPQPQRGGVSHDFAKAQEEFPPRVQGHTPTQTSWTGAR